MVEYGGAGGVVRSSGGVSGGEGGLRAAEGGAGRRGGLCAARGGARRSSGNSYIKGADHGSAGVMCVGTGSKAAPNGDPSKASPSSQSEQRC
jgi:hypothetical protein